MNEMNMNKTNTVAITTDNGTINANFIMWAYANKRNFYRVRNTVKAIAGHRRHITAMQQTSSALGKQGFWEAEYRLSHKPIDVLCEADDICKRVAAISSAYKDEFASPLLSKWYNIESVSLHADIAENEMEDMLDEFMSLANDIEIYEDSIMDSSDDEN